MHNFQGVFISLKYLNILDLLASGCLIWIKKVLLFGDFGIDDTIALLFLLFSKEVEIIGIVADYGNVERSKVLRNLNYIKYLGILNIPIFAGAETALTGIGPIYYPEVHGPEGLGSIIPQSPEGIICLSMKLRT